MPAVSLSVFGQMKSTSADLRYLPAGGSQRHMPEPVNPTGYRRCLTNRYLGCSCVVPAPQVAWHFRAASQCIHRVGSFFPERDDHRSGSSQSQPSGRSTWPAPAALHQVVVVVLSPYGSPSSFACGAVGAGAGVDGASGRDYAAGGCQGGPTADCRDRHYRCCPSRSQASPVSSVYGSGRAILFLKSTGTSNEFLSRVKYKYLAENSY
jgi:hypothetical protein